MEQGRKRTYTVKHPFRMIAVAAASLGVIALAVVWTVLLGRSSRRTADLAAYTTLTRTGETVTVTLDLDSLLTELQLPNPRTEPKAARNRAVKALLEMELNAVFTEEPDVMEITARVNEGALKRQGVVLKERTWTAPVKVLPRTAAQEEAPAVAEGERPRTVLADGYLTGLLDDEGKGLNLRKVCERVHFERDRLAKEIFGNTYVAKKTHLWFIVYPAGSERKNCYRAVYTLTDTSAEGWTIGSCAFVVDVADLSYRAGLGVSFAKTDVAIYDTAAEAERLDDVLAQGCAVTELLGGSVRGADRPSFDYNGFVRFVGLPLSHPLPDLTLWSPSSDALEEDDLWRLVGNGEYTMAELLAFVRMEIYARHGYTFPRPEEAAYRTHFAAYSWYSPAEDAPERFMTPTERRNLDLLKEIEDLLDT